MPSANLAATSRNLVAPRNDGIIGDAVRTGTISILDLNKRLFLSAADCDIIMRVSTVKV
jgi:hypothetical protein